MNIYLLRHGLAVEPGTADYGRDSERWLTPKGERKLWKSTQAMAGLDLTFDLILSSPLVRARQTADIVAEAFGARKKIELCDALSPGGRARQVVQRINHAQPEPENVLLVGHEPDLGHLVSLLVFGQPGGAVLMKKGGLCKLSVVALKHGRCATLEWLLTPKQMELMA
jgi:phosphohistidine phosphatase